jgi:hypothetical protein
MTASEMSDLIGAQVFLEAAPGLQVRCLITNAKSSYGKTRLRLLPVEGKGEAWVNADRVTPCDPASHPEGR